MKNKTLFLLCFTVTLFSAFSQSKKNDLKITVAGLPLIGNTDAFGSGVNGFVLKPTIGYFISDKTSIDINLSYSSLDNLKVGNVDSYYTSYAIIPTVRNNFVNSEKLRVFGETGFGVGTINYNPDNSSQFLAQHHTLSGGIFIVTIGLGANYFFNPNFGIELILPYINTKNVTSNSPSTLYSGIGPTVGLTFMLN